MRDDSWPEAVGRFTLTLQIIVGALVAGVLFFLVMLLLGIAAHFPTRARVTDWVRQQLELLENERPVQEKD